MNILFLKRQAQQAQTILDDEIFKVAVDGVELSIIDQWRSETDQKKRDDLWRDLQALQKIVSRLKRIVQEADVAVKQKR